jgi:C4-dicarboxylate-specific signal transduction histidine kinase
MMPGDPRGHRRASVPRAFGASTLALADRTMHPSQDAPSHLEDRPTLWPHPAAERALPFAIEECLAQAQALRLEGRERAGGRIDEAVALARADGDPNIVARTLYRAAIILRQARLLARAYALCLEAQPMLERQDDRWRATRLLLLRGQCCLDVGEHGRASALIGEAAERFRHMGNANELARCHANLAQARHLAAEHEAAVAEAERALTTLEPDADPALEARLRNNEAALRFERGRHLEAGGDRAGAQAEYARAAALLPDVATVVPRRPVDARMLDTAARIARATGDVEATATALARIATWTRRRGAYERGMAWLRLAQHHEWRGRPGAAMACARRAARGIAGVPSETDRVEAQVLLARLHEAAGDPKGAYECFDEGMRIEDDQHRATAMLRAELLLLDTRAQQELHRTEQTLAYAQRLSNVGHLVARVNHELNQPMASIRMLSETALELLERGERAEAATLMRSMHKLATRLTDLTAQLAAFPAQTPALTRPVGLRHAVTEALALLSSRLAETPCEIALDVAEVEVLALESQLVRVIANLTNNALDAMDAAPVRRIVFSCAAEGGRVALRIADSGHGLAPSVLERLFQPFFSTKTAGRGLGLGLPLSRDVMREMGGDLAASNGPDGGAVFEVLVPEAPAGLSRICDNEAAAILRNEKSDAPLSSDPSGRVAPGTPSLADGPFLAKDS